MLLKSCGIRVFIVKIEMIAVDVSIAIFIVFFAVKSIVFAVSIARKTELVMTIMFEMSLKLRRGLKDIYYAYYGYCVNLPLKLRRGLKGIISSQNYLAVYLKLRRGLKASFSSSITISFNLKLRRGLKGHLQGAKKFYKRLT